MSQPILMLVDSSEDFRLTLLEKLKGSYKVYSFQDGNDARKAAPQLNPHIIVLDLMLTGIDGLTLLQQLREENILPMVLALTRLHNEYVIDAAIELGIEYIMRKPCDPAAVVARIHDLSKRLNPIQNQDPESIIRSILNQLGISTRHRGYEYLLDAALMMDEHPNISLTKDLYPHVGAKYDSTATTVERSIRSALNVAWEKNPSEVWKEYSPVNEYGIMQRPSNGYFLAKLLEKLHPDYV